MLRVELFTQEELAEIMMGVCFSDDCDKCPEFTKRDCTKGTRCASHLVDTLTDEAEPHDIMNLMSDDCAELLNGMEVGSRAWKCAELAYLVTRIHKEIVDAVNSYDAPVKPSQIAYMIYHAMLEEECNNE